MQISVDDFGSGYSSLSHIKDLPIDVLKSVKSFIQEIENNPRDKAIVSTILKLANNPDLTVIAEGVENEKQYNFLKKADCNQIQGYYISRPIEAIQLKQLIESN